MTYCLTQIRIKHLQSAGLPDKVIQNILCLQNVRFPNQAGFSETLRKILKVSDFKNYGNAIIQGGQKSVRASRSKLPTGSKTPLRLTENDIDILRQINSYRYITSAILAELLEKTPASINRRTRKLWSHGYLGRLFQPKDYTRPGSNPAVHVISARGNQLLTDWLRTDPSHWGFSPLNNRHPDSQLGHKLLVSHIHAGFELACRKSNDADLIYWNNESRKHSTQIFNGNQRLSIKPDSILGIKRTGSDVIDHLCIEADRSTMIHKDMIAKFLGYILLYRHHNKQPIPAFNNAIGFRVLVVTEKSSDRIDNLIELILNLTGNMGSGLFWFASKEDIDLKNPSSILDPIWRIARPQAEYRSLRT